ncbi:MAG: HNH endonuclease, partial [Alphaproteobacteria bacterium]
KPTESHWRRFHDQLSETFFGICGYCEEEDKGEVDHFRPKSRYPERVYEWSNWVFSCHICNLLKGQKWPNFGYVDPCAKLQTERPESYFQFDTKTGEIWPKEGLNARRWNRGWKMIDDLGLNEYFHLKIRRKWLDIVRLTLSDLFVGNEKLHIFCTFIASRESRLSSITRVWLTENRYSFDDR